MHLMITLSEVMDNHVILGYKSANEVEVEVDKSLD